MVMKRGCNFKASRQQKQPSPKQARKEHSASPRTDNANMQTIKLLSPVGGDPLIFEFAETERLNAAVEILDTIKLALAHFTELMPVIACHYNIYKVDANNAEELNGLIQKFNKASSTRSSLWKGATKPGDEKLADEKLLKQICTRAYNRAVTDVAALNKHYEAFSSETYGETSFERLQMIIEEVAPKEHDVFVDLGSGVGQLIVQMAGGSRIKKAVGIEISQLPNTFAKQLEVEFTRWMNWFGKKFRPFTMEHGDFLSEKYRSLITQEATIIFINNFAFTSELDTRIKRELLAELSDGTRIISTKPYALPGRSINGRHMNDISMILDVREMKRCDNACSWTSNYVPYYMHTINHSRIELYYQNQKNPQARLLNSSENSRRSSVSHRSSRESSVMSSSNSGRHHLAHSTEGDDDPAGPTTRRKWSEQVGEGDHHKKSSSKDSKRSSEEKHKSKAKNLLRGRPRKSAPMSSTSNHAHQNSSATPKLSSDALDGLQQMHNMSRDIPMYVVKTEEDESLVKADLNLGKVSSKYPELDQYLDQQRVLMEKFLEYMKTPQYVEAVQQSIAAERLKHEDLLQRHDTLKKSVDQLVANGVTLLRERINELGMDAETPSAFLEQSKEIVTTHKRALARCAELECEITSLEMHNSQLAARKSKKHSSGADKTRHNSSENSQNALGDQEPQEGANSPASNGVPAAKKARSRSSRNYSHKRSPASAGKNIQEDPVKEKEVQMKIDLIVAEAMRVEKAAKCAEKERKAQRGDKKREKSVVNPTGPLKKRPSGEIPPAALPTPSAIMESSPLIGFNGAFNPVTPTTTQLPDSTVPSGVHVPSVGSLITTGDCERMEES